MFLLPFISGALSLILRQYAKEITLATSAMLVASSVLSYYYYEASIQISLDFLHIPFVIIDFTLLAYFCYIGFKAQDKKILFLALLQVAFLFAAKSYDTESGADIVVDKLSIFMFLLINVVGSSVLVYATRYIEDETPDVARRSVFLAILTAFLGVMNLLVSTDNIELLFLFFEMTTLASFWLIGFRKNEESTKNALTALWMNQIGGAALVFAVLVSKSHLHTVYISQIIVSGSEYLLLVSAFISIAALVKGAQIPFSGWLLGAMVAPTPVSAILHSSTMVKIAPYLLLKISPAISSTWVSYAVAAIGAVSFAVSAALALREDSFKKILAYSTISLLGLMALTAALATPLTVTACMLLIMFHGISKAMLFMCAGILEKNYHIKSIESVEGLISKAPVLTSLILLGFLSVALPPFGVFFAKWLAYEGITGGSGSLFLLFFIAVGSVALTLLYFKTTGRFVANDEAKKEGEDCTYLAAPTALGIILLIFALFVSPVVGTFFKQNASYVVSAEVPLSGDFWGIALPFGELAFWHILAAFLLLGLAPLLSSAVRLKGVDKASPYTCGERIEQNAYSFYFDPLRSVERVVNIGCAALFVAVAVLGVIGI